MSKKIVVPATAEGFNAVAKFLLDYEKTLKGKVEELIRVMCRNGEDYAINGVGHIDTGETLSSIKAYRLGNVGVIIAGGQALWIEFGTGVVANAGNAPHPKATELGMMPWGTYVAPYPVNKTGEPHGADPNGWWYYDDAGKLKHTYGIRGNKFFYNTAQMLRRSYPDMAKEIFGD